ncbi:hypothetical protein FISHEDRAFT_55527 [Fistulina hepatica ATCC 64428]|uniref:Uncharacterized protein n=1 Tax=Fistulina hepatica ATCC 64428 TaxID=1128425 RepID=A0A0D7ANH8_9AGAR|nr:hypothetical protein FISHEDRAFT_55527 [Fistulina hepatica ATCC 64428]
MSFFHLPLFPATEAQVLKSLKRQHPQWGKGLTLEQHSWKRERLSELDTAQDGESMVWVLAPRDDPQTIDFMCARARHIGGKPLVARSTDEKPKEAVAYGVASVFTPSSKHNKEDADRFLSSTIWDCMSTEWTIPQNVVASNDTVWTLPGERDLEDVWHKDSLLIRKDVFAYAEMTPSKAVFSYLPDDGVAEFLYARYKLMRPDTTVVSWGIKKDASGASLTFATWTADLVESSGNSSENMLVTRIQTSEEDFDPALLAHLLLFARHHSMERVGG